MKIGLLISGELGLSVAKQLLLENNIDFIMTDKNSGGIIQFCEQKNIPYFVGNPRAGRCSEFLKYREIDVLISVNYIFIIEDDLIHLPHKIAFNIHGSLLPKYRGRTPHVWSIINNEIETGITAHLIDKGCDTGDIIEQVRIPISLLDTGADVLAKFKTLYFPLIDVVLSKIKTNSVTFEKQEESKATFFGKRTPEDGRINWDWQKERIRNWVRAQAYPYPGAYTYSKEQQIIVDEVSFDEYGFDFIMPNGLILSQNPLLVKTPNGVIKLEKIRTEEVEFTVGDILN